MVNSVVLPAHAQTSSIVLTDVLVEGTYRGEQLAAGPFFSQKNLFGVQFLKQPAELVITSTEIIYKVGGEETRFPHGLKTLKVEPTFTYRSPESPSVVRRISQMLIPTAHARDRELELVVLIQPHIVSTPIITNRNVNIESQTKAAIEEQVINMQFSARCTTQCPGGGTVILSDFVIDTLLSSTIEVASVSDLLNIPSVGALFRSNDRPVNRNQLCIFLAPQIVDLSSL